MRFIPTERLSGVFGITGISETEKARAPSFAMECMMFEVRG